MLEFLSHVVEFFHVCVSEEKKCARVEKHNLEPVLQNFLRQKIQSQHCKLVHLSLSAFSTGVTTLSTTAFSITTVSKMALSTSTLSNYCYNVECCAMFVEGQVSYSRCKHWGDRLAKPKRRHLGASWQHWRATRLKELAKLRSLPISLQTLVSCFCRSAKCPYAQCHNAECRGVSPSKPNICG